MAKKSPDQMSLFDCAPTKKEPLIPEGTAPKPKIYKPLFCKTVYLVCYDDGKDVSHVCVPDYDLKDMVKYYDSYHDTVIDFTPEQYWTAFHKGVFQTGKAL